MKFVFIDVQNVKYISGTYFCGSQIYIIEVLKRRFMKLQEKKKTIAPSKSINYKTFLNSSVR